MKRPRLASAVAAAIAVPAVGLGLNGAASARTISAGFDTPVSAELTFSFAPGHAGFG
jgi:hypothetical protein